jgi:hypothetical protein
MFAVHYKFKSAKDDEYSSVLFDGPFISLSELKNKIAEQKKMGRAEDWDLQVVNAQTNEGMCSRNLEFSSCLRLLCAISDICLS